MIPSVSLSRCIYVSHGLTITEAGLLSAAAARGTGKCKYYSIALAFSSFNLGELDSLILVTLLYEATSQCPGGWGDVGDIPTSVAMSLTAAAPFDGTPHQHLALAYIAVLLIMFCIIFPLGDANWVAMDFRGSDVIDEDVREQLKPQRSILVQHSSASLPR
ncbi:hypothetical protein J3R83DRAFT_5347 [Lanmaoa asiatica]|nr:hypothetical protein J3R83DRAFT_5347 [Lanmaoa asiatica]